MTPTPNPPALLPVTQADIDLANLCVPSALIFADEAEHIADARARAAQHIARHRVQSTPAEPKVSREAVIEVPIDADAAHWITLAAEFLDTAAGMEMEIEGYDAMEIVIGLHALLDDDANRPFHEDVARWLKGKMRPTEPEELSNPPADGDGWRPFSSAPTDREIDLWCESAEGNGGGWRKTGILRTVAPQSLYDEDGHLYFPHENGGYFTHWMPLPSAPLGAGGEG